MTVAGGALAMREEALRSRHRNVQQSPFFLDLGR
jgi:hypothetical protein